MNGTMKYTRRINLGNYEHKEFTAEISYSVSEEDDYLESKGKIDHAADLAIEIVETRLGLRQPRIPVMAAKPARPTLVEAVHNLPITAEEVEKASAPVVDEPALAEHVPDQYNTDEVLAPGADEPLPEGDSPLADAGELSDTVPTDLPVAGSTDATEKPAAEFDLDAELAAAEPEISNDELKKTVHDWVTSAPAAARQSRVKAFGKLLANYTNVPQLSTVPQERRHAFLGEFAELKASVA